MADENILRPVRTHAGLIACVLLVSCGGGGAPDSTAADPTRASGPTAFVVNYPLEYLARRIAAGHVEIRFPAPADVDPAFWQPDDATVESYQQADLILLNGAGYAAWMRLASLPVSAQIDTSASFHDRYVEMDDVATHVHGPEGAHEHGIVAFTTWLDPTLAVEQARAITDAFNARWPAHRDDFERGYESLQQDLRSLDGQLEKVLAAHGDRPLLASHPVYQYLVRRYGLNVVSVHWEPDEVPNEAMWRELTRIIEAHPATIMLWEAAPIDETVTRLDALGIRPVVFDPCGKRPAAGDYLATMQANIDALRTLPARAD
ncbi:MAG: metal ABC transporter substrate-binding protein [Planctomycetota bacterium]|jgi:zinc transport system substrate-binding protein